MPQDPRPKLDLDLLRFLPYRLNRLDERISASLAAIYGDRFGLTVPDWRVLAWLSQHDALTAGRICQLAYMDKATVSRAVQRLERRGLLRRTASAVDQRSQVLSLTSEGRELLGELVPLALDWEARLLEGFSAQELRDLWHLLGRLERQVARMEGQDPEDGGADTAPS